MSSAVMSPACHLAAPLPIQDIPRRIDFCDLGKHEQLIDDQGASVAVTPGGLRSGAGKWTGGVKIRARASTGGTASHHRAERLAQNFLPKKARSKPSERTWTWKRTHCRRHRR